MTAQHLPARQFGGWHNVGLLFAKQFAVSGFVYFVYSAIFPVMVDVLDWNRGSASIAQSIALLMLGLCYPLTGLLIRKIGPKRTLMAGLLVMFAGILPIATVMTELWQWIVLWGFVVGFSFSLTGPVVPQTVLVAWFAKRRATSIGIVLTGAAIGGAVSQPVLAEIIKQTGQWQSGWYIALGMIAFALVTVYFVVDTPAQAGQFADNIHPGQQPGDRTAVSPSASGYRTSHDWKMAEILRSRAVFLLLMVSIGHLATFVFFLNHGLLFLTDGGMDRVSAAGIIGLAILGSGCARIPAGWLGDKYSLRWLAFGAMLFMLLGLVGFWQLDGYVASAASAILLGIGYGALMVLTPTIIGNYYGEKAFPMLNASFAPFVLPFAGAAPVVSGYIYEARGSYDLAFLIIIATLACASLAAFLLAPPHPAEPVSG